MACFLGPVATRAPRSDAFSRSDCDPRAQIPDRVGNPENDASIFFVNSRIIGGPMPPFPDSVGRSEKRPRSRSGKEQPSFRNYRILPSAFLPDRTVRGPQRPTRPNPRECCRDPGWGWGPLSRQYNTTLLTPRPLIAREGCRFRPEKWRLGRECPQKVAARHGILDSSASLGK